MKMNIVIFQQMLLGELQSFKKNKKIQNYITRLKLTKTDGDTGFNSNHLINGTHRLETYTL